MELYNNTSGAAWFRSDNQLTGLPPASPVPNGLCDGWSTLCANFPDRGNRRVQNDATDQNPWFLRCDAAPDYTVTSGAGAGHTNPAAPLNDQPGDRPLINIIPPARRAAGRRGGGQWPSAQRHHPAADWRLRGHRELPRCHRCPTSGQWALLLLAALLGALGLHACAGSTGEFQASR